MTIIWLRVVCKATVFENLVTLTHIQTLNPACFKGGKHWLLHGVTLLAVHCFPYTACRTLFAVHCLPYTACRTKTLSLLLLRLNAERQQNRKRTLCGLDLWNGVSYIVSHLEHWQILTHCFGLGNVKVWTHFDTNVRYLHLEWCVLNYFTSWTLTNSYPLFWPWEWQSLDTFWYKCPLLTLDLGVTVTDFQNLGPWLTQCHYQWYTRHLIKVCNGGIKKCFKLYAPCWNSWPSCGLDFDGGS